MAAITDLAALTSGQVADTDLLPIHDLSAGTDKKIARADFLGVVSAWTPYLNFSGNASGMTYSSRTGYYIRIGDLVYVACDIRLSAKGSSTGNVRIDGLPYTANASAAVGMATVLWYQLASNYVYVGGAIAASDVYVTLVGLTAAGASYAALTEAAIANNTILQMSMVYAV